MYRLIEGIHGAFGVFSFVSVLSVKFETVTDPYSLFHRVGSGELPFETDPRPLEKNVCVV